MKCPTFDFNTANARMQQRSLSGIEFESEIE
jgi:hypothetical protein